MNANTFIVEAKDSRGRWNHISTCCSYQFKGSADRAYAAAQKMALHLVEEGLAQDARIKREAR